MKAKSKIPKRTKILLILLVISLVILLATVIVGELWLRHIDRKFKRQEMSFQAKLFAEGNLEWIEEIITINSRIYTAPECWKTITLEQVCDPLTSPMMAKIGDDAQYYVMHFGYPTLIPVDEFTEFSDEMVIAREFNIFYSNQIYLGAGNAEPIPESITAESDYFYDIIKIKAFEADLDNDMRKKEALEVVNTVKWANGNKVEEYSMTRIFKQP